MCTFFSETGAYHIGYITIGDDYEKKPPKEDRDPPWPTRQILSNPVKKGSGPQVTFDWELRGHKYLSISEGEKYQDPGAQEKKTRLERSKKQREVHDKPFRYINPSKKASGLGNYYGCFNEWNAEDEIRGFRHETEYDVLKKGEVPEKKDPPLPNIKTNPTKRGTYGMPGTLLSDKGPRPGMDFASWTGNEYICDPYDRAHQQAKQRAAEGREQLQALGHPAPWKSQCRIQGRAFDTAGAQTGASQVYRLTRPLLPKKVVPPPERKFVSETPWKPPGLEKSGLAGFFGTADIEGKNCIKFPEYREDPYEIKEQREKDEREKNKPAFGSWKPVSYTKSLCTSSIEFRGY